MHEFSIMQSLLDLVEKEAAKNNLTKVTKITVKIGQLRQIVPDFLQFALRTATKNTISDGVELTIESVPIVIYCKKCKQRFSVKEHAYLCPKCDNLSIEILTGKEIVLTSIEGNK